MKTILTLTLNPAIDKSTTIDRMLPEHKLQCTNAECARGGGGINVPRLIKRPGGKSTTLCKV